MKPVLIPVLSGLVAAVFGTFCLNYTKGFGMDHHVEWAAETGMPGRAPASSCSACSPWRRAAA